MTLLFMDGFDASDWNLGKYTAFNPSANIAPSSTTRFGDRASLSQTKLFVSAAMVVRKDFTAVAKIIVGVVAQDRAASATATTSSRSLATPGSPTTSTCAS